MRFRRGFASAAGLLVLGAVAVVVLLPGSATGDPSKTGNNVLDAALSFKGGKAKGMDAVAGRVSSAPLIAAGLNSSENEKQANGGSGGKSSKAKTIGCQNVFTGGGEGGDNTRVNQDCSLRRQAEEVIAINPTDENNLIAGQNDSRIGFNACGYDFSFDGGKTWGDQVPPFYQFIMANGYTADACSDPTVTFDADGNAYIGGVLFQIGDAASAFVVAKSNAGIGGSFFHTPAPLSFQTSRTTPLGVVASDNDSNIFHDKEFIAADASKSSPKKNNVYATWTLFEFGTGQGVGGHSPIYFSQSTNGGATWSAGVEISGSSAAACTDFSGEADPNACDQNQGSFPTVGKDGTLYVTFGNGNTPTPGVNQVLFVKCPANKDCSVSSNWSTPAKVGTLYDFQPFGPSAAGCPGGRTCLPPNGYRLDDFVTISNSIDKNGKLFVTWSDGRNIAASCQGSAATATPPCDNDVFYAYSTDGGSSWSSTKKVSPAGSAQWQPWSKVTSDGTSLWIAYYDRSYGSCETSGCNDITAVEVKNPATASPSMKVTRVTTSSMPNLTPATNPVQAGFLGDYMWVDVDSKGRAHIVWADTRGKGDPADPPEEDIYFATVK